MRRPKPTPRRAHTLLRSRHAKPTPSRHAMRSPSPLALTRGYYMLASPRGLAVTWMVFACVLCLFACVLRQVWEGLVTLFLFPMLLFLAYAFDVKLCSPVGLEGMHRPRASPHRPRASPHPSPHASPHPPPRIFRAHPSCLGDAAGSRLVDIGRDGKPINKDDIAMALKHTQGAGVADPTLLSNVVAHALVPNSRAYYRVQATRAGTAGKVADLSEDPAVNAALNARGGAAAAAGALPVLAFEASAMTVQEGQGYATLPVVLTGGVPSGRKVVTVEYETVAVTATADEDYESTQGTLTFRAGISRQEIRVRIIDDDIPEDDETFYVQLSSPVNAALSAKDARCVVTIEDDDQPGELGFVKELMTVSETCGDAVVIIRRSRGSKGVITVDYTTRDGTAVAPSDYTHMSGTLTFESGEVEQTLRVPIIDDAAYELDEVFQIVLSEPTGGASFVTDADGYPDGAICTLTITCDKQRQALVDDLTTILNLNVDNISLAANSWGEQFADAFVLEESDLLSVGLYILSLPWKLLFALVPPARLAGGWLCFFVSLCGIGLLTALIGDLAGHMGCTMGLLPSVTAITFVALGTSLPDTFASAQASAAPRGARARARSPQRRAGCRAGWSGACP